MAKRKELPDIPIGKRISKGIKILTEQEGVPGHDHDTNSIEEDYEGGRLSGKKMPNGFHIVHDFELEKEHYESINEESLGSGFKKKRR